MVFSSFKFVVLKIRIQRICNKINKNQISFSSINNNSFSFIYTLLQIQNPKNIINSTVCQLFS